MKNEVVRNIELFLDGFDGDIRAGLEYVLQIVEDEAKLRCPYDNGELRRRITHQVQDTVGVVGTNVSYAPYVHEGTGIYAADGQGRKEVPWRYQDEEGHWHSTSGQKPQPFLRDAMDSLQGELLTLLKEGMQRG